jgi:DNA repair protein RadA/Sms
MKLSKFPNQFNLNQATMNPPRTKRMAIIRQRYFDISEDVMAKQKTTYKCTACGNIVSRWSGQCPHCSTWNTIEEYIEPIGTPAKMAVAKAQAANVHAVKLKDIQAQETNRIKTSNNEFDRVVGGGLVHDSMVILAGVPGIGKSTLLLSVANLLLSLGKIVIYASGEESSSQIKARAERLKLDYINEMYISDTTCMNDVLTLISQVDADFVIVDSVNTFTLNEHLPSRAGSPVQTVECASALQDCAKRGNKPRAIIMVGQVNKDDELTGMRSLEHMVDTVLMLEGDSQDTFRILYTTKNRFGDTGETGFFQMTERGMEEVRNPSEFFLTTRSEPVVGTALTVLKEGSRPIVAEIESLVTKSFTSFPTRITETMSRDRLNVLISILEQHCGMTFIDKNVIINAQNNLKLKKSDTSLATLMSICSSYFKKPLPFNSVYLADVGLTGELKKVPNIDIRLKELDRMGYGDVYVAHNTQTGTYKNIHVIKCNKINDVLNGIGFKSNQKS